MTNISTAKPIVLRDVTFNHIRVGDAYKPSFATAKDSPQWSLQAIAEPGTPAFDAMLDLKELGVPIALEDEKLVLKANLYQTTQAGKAQSISVYDADYTEMDIEYRRTVGNGSKGHLVGYYYAYANEHGVGMTANFSEVVITEKVDYIPETPEERLKRLFG